jgi:hypothetical protein
MAGAASRRAMLILCITCVLDICRAFTAVHLTDDVQRGQSIRSWSGKQWNTPHVSQGLLPKNNPRCKGGFLLARSMAKGPSESLKRGEWFKLICGASNQDMPQIRNLALAYTRRLSSSIFSIPHPLTCTLADHSLAAIVYCRKQIHAMEFKSGLSSVGCIWHIFSNPLHPLDPDCGPLPCSVLLISQLCPLF